MAVPFGDGVTVHDTWDTIGHAWHGEQRHHASTTCSCPTSKILADRPYGVVDPPLQVIVSIAMPIISAVYLGVAEAAAAAAIDAVRDKADTTHRPAPGRADAAPPAGRRLGARRRARRRSATTRRRRWRPWPR